MTITPGTLYLVGTPIGNLGDLSPRALETLSKVDFIAAEDTRVTGALLAHHGIKKPLVSYYEHNLRQRGEQILARLKAGESCALCTDAGMPAISDPGCDIVRLCHEAGVPVADGAGTFGRHHGAGPLGAGHWTVCLRRVFVHQPQEPL